ncbi:unnamed protein product [Ectocarpus sp. 13 AM-2016]
MAKLQATPEEQAVAEGKKSFGAKKQTKKQGEGSDLYKIVRLVMDRSLDPAIVFSFAKKECEGNALQMSKLDFNDDSEKLLVEQVFGNAMESLADEDRQLPQVEAILPLLKRGVGIHHGGLLPILKEVIEILFQEGLIKILFATETFSIGLNMPARTVVFTNTRKFDGQDFRWITSGEYIQMSGRAGRRGKDDRGIVIQMLDEKMDPQVAKGMLYGEADALNSSYHISYNMLLNMLRVEDADPDFLVKSSFNQFQQEASAPALEEEASDLDSEKKVLAAGLNDEERTSEYFLVRQQLERTRAEVCRVIQRPENCLPYIQAGRLVRIRGSPARHGDQNNKQDGREANGHQAELSPDNQPDWGWGATVDLNKKASSKAGDPVKYEVGVLVKCKPEESARRGGQHIYPPTPMEDGEMRVVHFTLDSIAELSSIRLMMPNDLRAAEARAAVAENMKEAFRRIQDSSLEKLLARETQLQLRLEGLPFHNDKDREEQLQR